jgi:hypothetical protein
VFKFRGNGHRIDEIMRLEIAAAIVFNVQPMYVRVRRRKTSQRSAPSSKWARGYGPKKNIDGEKIKWRGGQGLVDGLSRLVGPVSSIYLFFHKS